MISKTSTVTPIFFAFLVKVDHYLSAWQVLKKSVRGNILGANILKAPNLNIDQENSKVTVSHCLSLNPKLLLLSSLLVVLIITVIIVIISSILVHIQREYF